MPSDSTLGTEIISGSADCLLNETKQNIKHWAVTDVWSFSSQSERKSSDGNQILCIAASAEIWNNWKELAKTWQSFFVFEVLQTPVL